MRGIIIGFGAILGVALLGAAPQAAAQPGYGSGDRAAGSPSYRGGTGDQPGYGRDGREQTGYDDRTDGQGSYGQDAYGRGPCGRSSSDDDSYSYADAHADRCSSDDDQDGRGSWRCHHRARGEGWYRHGGRDAYLRGDHYRGYWEDGTGRRYYDRGGYGVGHFDYTRDYNPLRGY